MIVTARDPVGLSGFDMAEQVGYIAGQTTTEHPNEGLTGGLAMSSKRAFVIASVGLLLMPVAALAHHALEAQFNTKETIALTGVVKRMDWSNPHVRLYIEVKEESNAVTWEVDMGSPNKQLAAGWKIDTYRHGDLVRVEAYPARNGSNIAYGRRVTHLSR